MEQKTYNLKKIERSILIDLIGEGLSNRDIAKKLGISERGVYRKRIAHGLVSSMDISRALAVLKDAGYKIIKK